MLTAAYVYRPELCLCYIMFVAMQRDHKEHNIRVMVFTPNTKLADNNLLGITTDRSIPIGGCMRPVDSCHLKQALQIDTLRQNIILSFVLSM